MTGIDAKKTLVVSDSMSISKFGVLGLTIATLLSCFGSVFLVEKNGLLYELPLEFVEMPMNPSNAYMARYKIVFREMLCCNYAIQFAIVGAMLGLAFGTVGATRSRRSAIAASILGGAVGGAVFASIGGFLLGLIASFFIGINWETIRYIGFQIDPLVQTTFLQCAIWVCVGIGIGFGCTLMTCSFARIVKGIQGGILGGILAGIVHSVVAAIFFSGSNAFDFVPENFPERIVWAAICGLSICYGLVFLLAVRSIGPEPSGTESTSTGTYSFDSAN